MTKVIVNAGACGFTVTITAKKTKDKKIHVSLDTECEMVKKVQEDISMLDLRAAFTNHLNNPVYRAAAKHIKHVACPVMSGILKAVEVEAGLSVSKDASIVFSKK